MSRIVTLTNQLEDDVNKANVFVNGDEKATYIAADGTEVRSIRNLESEGKLKVGDAEGFAKQAESAALRAESAKGGAFVNSNVYQDIESGMKEVEVGDQFQVLSDDGFQYLRYRKDSESKYSLVASISSSNVDALSLNIGKNFPLRAVVRNGVVSNHGQKVRDVYCNISIFAPAKQLENKYFRIAYLQNGASLGGIKRNGIRIEEFDADTYETNSQAVVIHSSSDEAANYDRSKGGIQTFSIIPALRPDMVITITLNVDGLPSDGIAFTAGNATTSHIWSWIVDPSCYIAVTRDLNPKKDFQGYDFPLKKMERGGKTSLKSVVMNDALLDISVIAPKDIIHSKYFRISYFQNGAILAGVAKNGIRVEMYDRTSYQSAGEGVSIHTPQDEEAAYDLDLGGIQSFEIVCAQDSRVKLLVTLDVDKMPAKGDFLRMSWTADDAWSWIIDPSCYVSSGAQEKNTDNKSISGIMALGASLMNSVNGWFEDSSNKLGIIGMNKAVGGQTPYYHANKIYRGTLCTDQEFEDADILAIQYASSKDLDSQEGLFPYSEDYTADFDIENSANQFTNKYTHAQTVDYILKYWRERCYEQRNNPNSKWHGTKFGKPFRVVFVTYWHDSRDYYNLPVRNLAKRWGASVCPFDEKIGFSKASPMPDGTQTSVLYAMDTQVVDGVTYGWHPSRGDEGKYIQETMGNIFAETIIQSYL